VTLSAPDDDSGRFEAVSRRAGSRHGPAMPVVVSRIVVNRIAVSPTWACATVRVPDDMRAR